MEKKSPDAFRTISEVADWLGVPTHVLRFWESRFSQVKPVKRAGGRRYYRPGDMELLGGIRKLLHEDGMTIRGVQKLLREEGVKNVAAMSPPLDQGDLRDVTPTNVVSMPAKPSAPNPVQVELVEVAEDSKETAAPTEQADVPELQLDLPVEPTEEETIFEAVLAKVANEPGQTPDGPVGPPAEAVEAASAEGAELSDEAVPEDAPSEESEPETIENVVAALEELEDTPVEDVSEETAAPVDDTEPTLSGATPIDISHIAQDPADTAEENNQPNGIAAQLRRMRATAHPLNATQLQAFMDRLGTLSSEMNHHR